MKIRKAKKEDKKNIKKFRDIEWNKSNNERSQSFKGKEVLLIALEGKKIVGFLRVKIMGGVCDIRELLVSKDLRRKNIGKGLVKKLELISKKEKCHAITLETSEKHKEALKFYKKLKFKKIATLKNNKFKCKWYIFEKRLK